MVRLLWEGVALLEELYHPGRALKFGETHAILRVPAASCLKTEMCALGFWAYHLSVSQLWTPTLWNCRQGVDPTPKKEVLFQQQIWKDKAIKTLRHWTQSCRIWSCAVDFWSFRRSSGSSLYLHPSFGMLMFILYQCMLEVFTFLFDL